MAEKRNPHIESTVNTVKVAHFVDLKECLPLIIMTINAHHHIVIMIHKKCMPGGPKSANQKLADEGKHTR